MPQMAQLIPGANIQIKGTAKGTVTNPEGACTLSR